MRLTNALCGEPVCSVAASGDGRATMNVTAVDSTWSIVTASLVNGAPGSGQAVGWQSNAAGIAPQSLTVGPLAEGQLVTIDACLNGTSQCVAFSAIGARPEYGFLEAFSGTMQTLSVAGTPAQITLRLLDMDGNPMAAGSVSLYQALYAWAPPCGSHSACPPSNLLATQTATATSALDGTVTFSPAALPGVATNLVALAASGNTATLSITVERHP